MSNRSNDHLTLAPQTTFDGPALTFDFPALHIGVAEYAEGPTGCTVFHFPAGAALSVDMRGGAIGMIGDYDYTDAICLAGGSIYGLEAAVGVSAELLAMREYSTAWDRIALVSGAIIYDYGTRRDNAIYPDKALGRAALRVAQPGVFPLGNRGAGRSARVGAGFARDRGEPGGQGGAFRQIGDTKIAAFTVVNALGAIVGRDGAVVRGHKDPVTGTRDHWHADLERRLVADGPTTPAPGNTTLSVVVTNQKLDARTLKQIGRQVHSSMARAIQPFHTLYDGDVLFAVTTNESENPALNDIALGLVASDLMWDAVLNCFEPA